MGPDRTRYARRPSRIVSDPSSDREEIDACGVRKPDPLGCEAVLMEHSAAPTSMLDEASELPCAFACTDRIRIYAPHTAIAAGYDAAAKAPAEADAWACCARLTAPGGTPMTRLNARAKAASER